MMFRQDRGSTGRRAIVGASRRWARESACPAAGSISIPFALHARQEATKIAPEIAIPEIREPKAGARVAAPKSVARSG